MALELLKHDVNTNHTQPVLEENAGDLFGRIGSLETRLARNEREIDAAQAVRFRVFVEEMNAQLPPDAMRSRRDVDAYDAICDHLLVVDTAIDGDIEDQIVGTYRLLRQEVAVAHGGFYSASEFDRSEANTSELPSLMRISYA